MPEVLPSFAWKALACCLAVAVAVRGARAFAVWRALYDQPNERSSHSVPTPRLGGMAFVPIYWLLLASIAVAPSASAVKLAALGGTALLYLVSALDDVRGLPVGVRFAGQAIAAFWLVVAALPPSWGQSGALHVAFVVLAIAFIVGCANLYNFMDGIDGIAGCQGLVGGLAWCAIGWHVGSPLASAMGALLAASAAGFLTFNWPPARIFMGDAGSTMFGFSFGALPFIAAVDAARDGAIITLLPASVAVLWPFLADGTFTILRRIRRGENILKAHRSHVYQRLVIAGQPVRRVTSIYAALALLGGLCAYFWTVKSPLCFAAFAALVLSSLGTRRWAVREENRK